MHTTSIVDVESLVIEIQRYLAAVDAFRAAGCRPYWIAEQAPLHRART